MWTLMKRELMIATRSGSGVGLGLSFFLVIVLISAISTGRDPVALAQSAPGTLWVGALLAGLLSLDRMFQADHEDGTLDGLLLAPLPLTSTVIVKVLAHWITAGLPLVILSPLMALMLNLPVAAYGWMIASLGIGTLSLSAIGAIGAAITLGVRRGGLLLSLLVTPLYIPSLIFGVRVIEDGSIGGDPLTPLALLLGLTLAALVLGPVATVAALRVTLR